MQSMTSPIQPTDQQGHVCKKPSCWLYGFAVIGGCSVLVVIGIIITIVTVIVRSTDQGITISNSYSDPVTGEEVVVTSTYSLNEAIKGGFSVYQLLRDEGISIEDVQSQDPEELEACMFAELGESRVIEIYNGDVPTSSDIAALRTCLK